MQQNTSYNLVSSKQLIFSFIIYLIVPSAMLISHFRWFLVAVILQLILLVYVFYQPVYAVLSHLFLFVILIFNLIREAL